MILFLLLCSTIINKITFANVCSRSLPFPSGPGGSFIGGVQLLIPSWTFSCQGTINNWFAHVTGNTSVTVGSGIEFQVLKPDPVKSNVYNLIYGNTYGDGIAGALSADGSRIRFDVKPGYFLPVRPGYIVGVYIDSNAVNKLSLIYGDTAEDIDIYYWENLTGRMCDLSLCDAKVMRGARPLIGWTFSNASETALSTPENAVKLLRSNTPEYCNETEVSSCVLPSVESTMSSTLISLSSSPPSSLSSSLSSSLYSSSSFLISFLPISPSFLSTPSSFSPIPAPSSPFLSTPSSFFRLTTPSSPPTQGEDDGSVLIIQVSLALGSIIVALIIIIFVIILCSYCLYRNKASIKLVTSQSFNKTNNIGDITNDANPCYGMNINSTGNDIFAYDELDYLNIISDSQNMITNTEANPCYGVSNESQLPSGIEPEADDDYI